MPAAVLIGTVGYHNLRNHSLGPILLPELQRLPWPAEVLVEELNWGPIAVVQRLQTETSLERVVLLGARPSSLPEGTLSLYRWVGGLPGPDEIQARIGEAVTGVISLDNLLVVGEHFQAWPPQVLVVDVAPGSEETGASLRPVVAARRPEVLDWVRRLALEGPEAAPQLLELRGDTWADRQIRELSSPSRLETPRWKCSKDV